MSPTGYAARWPATRGSGTGPIGPAMTTLRSVIAYLAAMVRCAGTMYIIVQVVIWHSFYTAASWRLAAPALAAPTKLELYYRAVEDGHLPPPP
jgi:hypothetical protein